MDYRMLRATGLEVSELTLGTMTFGDQTGEKEAKRIVDLALSRGVNSFDTANSYTQGASEEILGRALRGRRNEVILATKVFNQMGEGRNGRGLSRHNILASVEASLKRLQTDYIDIYYLHEPDYATPIEETLAVMTELRQAGKIRYLGVSNFAAWQIAEAVWTADKHNYIKPILSQNVYNLITRGADDELMPFLDRYDIGMFAYNPIAAGLLSGKYTGVREAIEGSRFAVNSLYAGRYWREDNLLAAERLTALAAENGLTLLELAMQFVLRHPVVDSVISGVTKLEQLESNLVAIEKTVTLPDELLDELDLVWADLTGHRFKYNR